jgi:hypothetical protein
MYPRLRNFFHLSQLFVAQRLRRFRDIVDAFTCVVMFCSWQHIMAHDCHSFPQGYRGVFWASAFVGYAVLFAYGVRGIYLSRASRMYLQTFGYVISFCDELIAAVKLLTAYYGHSFQNRAPVHESCRALIVKNY